VVLGQAAPAAIDDTDDYTSFYNRASRLERSTAPSLCPPGQDPHRIASFLPHSQALPGFISHPASQDAHLASRWPGHTFSERPNGEIISPSMRVTVACSPCVPVCERLENVFLLRSVSCA